MGMESLDYFLNVLSLYEKLNLKEKQGVLGKYVFENKSELESILFKERKGCDEFKKSYLEFAKVHLKKFDEGDVS